MVRAFARGVVSTGIRKVLELELSMLPEGWTESLRGSGMLIVNPPFGLDDRSTALAGVDLEGPG